MDLWLEQRAHGNERKPECRDRNLQIRRWEKIKREDKRVWRQKIIHGKWMDLKKGIG